MCNVRVAFLSLSFFSLSFSPSFMQNVNAWDLMVWQTGKKFTTIFMQTFFYCSCFCYCCYRSFIFLVQKNEITFKISKCRRGKNSIRNANGRVSKCISFFASQFGWFFDRQHIIGKLCIWMLSFFLFTAIFYLLFKFIRSKCNRFIIFSFIMMIELKLSLSLCHINYLFEKKRAYPTRMRKHEWTHAARVREKENENNCK